MIHNVKEYFSYTVKDKNLLIYSNNDFTKYTSVLNEFNAYKICDITEVSLDNLGAYIVTNSIDTVLIDFVNDAEKVYNILESFDHKVHVMLYVGTTCEARHTGLLNLCEAVIAEPFSEETLMYKFFTMLNDESAIRAINNASCSLSRVPKTASIQLEDYLDVYEGQILFLSEALQSSLDKLDSGELSHDLLADVANQIDEVAGVFANHFYTKRVAPIFVDLSKYLREIKLDKIEIENLEGFDYLSRIIEDINAYLIEYFVDRLFNNVYVFEDSLANSVQFMKDRLSNTKDESSELEFF